jgi:Flp pilus assembly pilin Flp
MSLMPRTIRFLGNERGNALSEYALVAAILAMAMLGTLGLINTRTGNNIARTGTALTNQSYTP